MTLLMFSISNSSRIGPNNRCQADSNLALTRICSSISNLKWVCLSKIWTRCNIRINTNSSKEWWCNKTPWWEVCRCSSQWACRWEETQCRDRCRILCTANSKIWTNSNSLRWTKWVNSKCSWTINSSSPIKCSKECRWTQTRDSSPTLSASWTSEQFPDMTIRKEKTLTK